MMKKFYNILLIAEEKSREPLERLRVKFTGSKLVDLQPPHVTIKRKFTLKNGFLEIELIALLQKFEVPKMFFSFEKLEKFGDAYVFTGSNTVLSRKHKEILSLLRDFVDTVNPEWEGENFSPHVTLVRNIESEFFPEWEIMKMKGLFLDMLQLVEMDPSPEKKFSNIVYSQHLL